MTTLELMDSYKEEYTKSEYTVYEVIRNHIVDVSRMTANGLAEKYHISQSSLTRFAKRMGFVGYNELKYAISREIYDSPPKKDTIFSRCSQYLVELEKSLQNFDYQSLNQDFIDAKHIYITGIQRNVSAGKMLEYVLKEYGYGCQYASLNDDLLRLEAFICKKDLLIIFSYNGSDNYRHLIEIYKDSINNNLPKIILITQNPEALLKEYAYKTILLPDAYNMNIDLYVPFCIFATIIEQSIIYNPNMKK